MLSSLFQSSSLPLLENVGSFTEARHGVLAGNIANLDTPGYKTRDLSPQQFQERLKEAIEKSHEPPTRTYSPNGIVTGNNTADRADRNLDAFRKVEDSMKSILRHDEGDV